jgi:hypothetical protein
MRNWNPNYRLTWDIGTAKAAAPHLLRLRLLLIRSRHRIAFHEKIARIYPGQDVTSECISRLFTPS